MDTKVKFKNTITSEDIDEMFWRAKLPFGDIKNAYKEGVKMAEEFYRFEAQKVVKGLLSLLEKKGLVKLDNHFEDSTNN